ncbi:hypothetical protein C6P40_001206 [Pichia californica]|uniref:Eukaryotic translation initiation factor 4E n=1 Tax=Pichia californica TaxID=460514 RepID=A0A9P6WJF1_9ASCO|nr:hypothetical protein C6P42_000287 [[Candida] californica]KAG0688251.1 hypothetical protein C6P40_001206 [[Candida] californica]
MSRIFDDLPSSLNTSFKNDDDKSHKLAYEWTFWQHFRPTSIPTDTTKDQQSNEQDDETESISTEFESLHTESNYTEESTTNTTPITTADMRDVQYLNGTTLLTFPKFNNSISNLQINQTDTIDTIEQFWESFINLKSINDVPIDTEYFFFKKGIKPMWEDEFNKNGGRWYFSLNNNNLKHRRNLMCVFWELLLIKLISGNFLPLNFELPLNNEILDNPEFNELNCEKKLSNKELNKLIMDDIAGIVISLRSKKIIISIWNTHLSYEKYKIDNKINNNTNIDNNNLNCVKNEEYNHMFRENLNFKSKHIFEQIGLTIYQFRQLIYESISQTLYEALNLVKTKENSADLNRAYKQKIFKYLSHFHDTPRITDNNKKLNGNGNGNNNKFKSKKNFNNGDWNSYKNLTSINGTKLSNSETEKFSNLGKLRKKVEFTNEGLMVEELNVLSFKQKWNRKRRPFLKNRNSDQNNNINIEYGYDNYDDDE